MGEYTLIRIILQFVCMYIRMWKYLLVLCLFMIRLKSIMLLSIILSGSSF